MTNDSTLTVNPGFGPQPIAYFDRDGSRTPVLFVHGLGNAASNFEDTLTARPLAGHRLIALDLPGCGASPYPRTTRLDIDGVVKVLEAFVGAIDPPPFLIVGASLGGLVSLLYAERHPDRLVGFLNVEGNLAPEDCMFSRLVVPHPYEEFTRTVLPEIKRSVAARTGRGFAKHLEVLDRADPRAYYDYSFQTVEYSDNGRLLERFLSLPVPVHFVYGSVNRGLTYLPRLRDSRCTLTEIRDADHFLFYDAPEAFAECVRRSTGAGACLEPGRS
ncbi:MAG TPA: alpha/beta hydrolase [Candidatus Polarisedimenticolia bacterium]|nr:alpha/beta hydrolase [Candidatus Polarisedimenticolia bacterium]